MAATFPQVCEAIQAAIGPNPRRGRLKELADELATSGANVSRWYSGESSPDREQWPRIEAALGLAPGTLASAAAGAPPTTYLTELPADITDLPALVASLIARVEAIEAQISRQQHPVSRPRNPKVVDITTPTLGRAARKKTPPKPT